MNEPYLASTTHCERGPAALHNVFAQFHMNRWLLTHAKMDKGRDAPMDRTHSAYGIGKLDPNPTTIGDSKNWYTYSNNHIYTSYYAGQLDDIHSILKLKY